MSTTDLAINDSLSALHGSLEADLQMLRNYRTALVKSQEFSRVDAIKEVEQKIEQLMQTITASIIK